MARVRVSTTVDELLLTQARRALKMNDAALLDAALSALLARQRAVELDAGYAVYDEIPLETSDAWGDLSSFREAAASS